MKYLLPLLLLMLSSCQGKLTEEQKKEMRDGMEANQIKKISEAEIVEAAFNYGRSIADKVNELNADLNNLQINSDLQEQFHVKIFPLEPGDSLLMEIEQLLIEAYTSAKNVELKDNVQKVGADSLLYTLPVMEKLDDGSIQFKYALGIRMSKKEVILSMEKK